MILPGISSQITNQSVRGQTESNATQSENSNSSGWKYVTVTEGNITYTYIVIGKNMKVLIGTSTVQEEEKNKKNADSNTDANGNSSKANAAPQNDNAKLAAEKVSFLSDYRMLGLTGYYQKKMRETMENMEDQLGCDKLDAIAINKRAEQNATNE